MVSSNAEGFLCWAKSAFTGFSAGECLSITLGTLIATGIVTLYSNYSLNERDKAQLKREEDKERKQQQELEKQKRQEIIAACEYYTCLIQKTITELFIFVNHKNFFEKNIKAQIPFKTDEKYILPPVPTDLFGKLFSVSPEAARPYFAAQFYIGRLNSGLYDVLKNTQEYEKDAERIFRSETIMDKNIVHSAMYDDYAKYLKNVFFDLKTDDFIRDGFYSVATQCYLRLLISIFSLQQDSHAHHLNIDVCTDGRKYFPKECVRYLETEEAKRIFDSFENKKFTHAQLIQAYLESPNDILNAAERLAADGADVEI